MDSNQDLIIEVYYFLQKVSKGITNDTSKQHDLTQEVILQLLHKDIKILEQLKERKELDRYLCSVMYTNFSSSRSSLNYHERRYKDLVPYSLDYDNEDSSQDANRVENYKMKRVKETKKPKDEYIEQKRLLSYMKICVNFCQVDLNIMTVYFLNGYNFKETYRELTEGGYDGSYGWLHSRLKEVKDKIPKEFKARWTS